jgi:hypothetical protein
MADDDPNVTALLRQASLSFIGTVEVVRAATMSNVPIDGRTVVVRVNRVLHAPEAFASLRGQRITVQCAEDAYPPEVGHPVVFFAEGLAFGESIVVAEVGRLQVEQVEHLLERTASGERDGFAALEREIEISWLRERGQEADAVVLGRVIKLEKLEQALNGPISEHDPDWWRATLEVLHVERGDISSRYVAVLYPNSIDVAWRASPKPKASQDGLFLLHATQGALADAAPFQIVDPEDLQPPHNLDLLRGRGG